MEECQVIIYIVISGLILGGSVSVLKQMNMFGCCCHCLFEGHITFPKSLFLGALCLALQSAFLAQTATSRVPCAVEIQHGAPKHFEEDEEGGLQVEKDDFHTKLLSSNRLIGTERNSMSWAFQVSTFPNVWSSPHRSRRSGRPASWSWAWTTRARPPF